MHERHVAHPVAGGGLPEEEASFAEGGAAEGQGEDVAQLLGEVEAGPCRPTSSGRSSRSASLSLGRMISVIPARTAPRTFSLTPPIGSTRPESVISPVIATSRRTGRPDSAETSAVAMVTPAEGPSFGIAPAGTWMWTSRSKHSAGMPSRSACARA